MFTLKIDERNIKIEASENKTSPSFVRGTVGAKCKVIFTDFWFNYNKTVVFKRSSNALGVPYIVLVDKLESELTIPWEVLKESGTFKVGAYGTTDTETLPTLWSDDITIEYGSDTAGQAPPPPTPNVYQELIEIAKQAVNTAQSVEERANNGEFNGKDGKDGEKGDTGPQGPAGADGKDYILTDADKQEIADIVAKTELAAVNAVLDQIITSQQSYLGGDSV